MTARAGYVAEAAAAQLAAALASRFPGLPDHEIQSAARAQVADLRETGWRISAPVSALADRPRARKTDRA
ncbi:hypothetical protein OG548_14270 [Streptomyces sp. NBC_01356]|uniref:hypothetical protein n=1 Tax=Streptomyces sp. NBC_01356 TaxID=2903836 RepID=UPI002E3122BA|nr:hypothetical protein [Streptomyces sp. NBC_01356]